MVRHHKDLILYVHVTCVYSVAQRPPAVSCVFTRTRSSEHGLLSEDAPPEHPADLLTQDSHQKRFTRLHQA